MKFILSNYVTVYFSTVALNSLCYFVYLMNKFVFCPSIQKIYVVSMEGQTRNTVTIASEFIKVFTTVSKIEAKFDFLTMTSFHDDYTIP